LHGESCLRRAAPAQQRLFSKEPIDFDNEFGAVARGESDAARSRAFRTLAKADGIRKKISRLPDRESGIYRHDLSDFTYRRSEMAIAT
jgi:hypothetical protein